MFGSHKKQRANSSLFNPGILKNFYLLLLCFSFFACSPEQVDPPTPVSGIQPGDGFFILNEGGFNFGNASLSYYHYAKDSVEQIVFQRANGRPLGDVLQSATLRDSLLYLVLNNSGKIEVANLKDLSSQATWEGFNSPRHLEFFGVNTAFVTDLYADAIQVVDLQNEAISTSINVADWTEELVLHGDSLFVLQKTSNAVLIIDPHAREILGQITVAFDPSALAKNGNNLWVYSLGQVGVAGTAALQQIDLSTGTLVKSLPIPGLATFPWPRLKIDPTGANLYLLIGDLYRIPADAATFPDAPLVKSEGQNFYGLGISPHNGHIYLADAIDYQQKGVVLEYDTQGTLLSSFQVGVIPNGFLFY